LGRRRQNAISGALPFSCDRPTSLFTNTQGAAHVLMGAEERKQPGNNPAACQQSLQKKKLGFRKGCYQWTFVEFVLIAGFGKFPYEAIQNSGVILYSSFRMTASLAKKLFLLRISFVEHRVDSSL